MVTGSDATLPPWTCWIMSASGPGVRSPHDVLWTDGIHISPAGSSVTAVDTISSIRLLLGLPCLFQLTHLLMCFTDSMHINEVSLIIILMADSSYFVNCIVHKCLIRYLHFFWVIIIFLRTNILTLCGKPLPVCCDLKQMCHKRPCTVLTASQVSVKTTAIVTYVSLTDHFCWPLPYSI